MKSDCCDSDALYITASHFLLCEIGKRAFELGQRSIMLHCGSPAESDGQSCVICSDSDLDTTFCKVGDDVLCQSCFDAAMAGRSQWHDRVYPLNRVYVCQMWPDGPWLLQGTIQGGLAEMVERMCVHHTTESVLHAMAEYIHAHATEPCYSFRTLYDCLWFRFTTVGVLKARQAPYLSHYPMDQIDPFDKSEIEEGDAL